MYITVPNSITVTASPLFSSGADSPFSASYAQAVINQTAAYLNTVSAGVYGYGELGEYGPFEQFAIGRYDSNSGVFSGVLDEATKGVGGFSIGAAYESTTIVTDSFLTFGASVDGLEVGGLFSPSTGTFAAFAGGESDGIGAYLTLGEGSTLGGGGSAPPIPSCSKPACMNDAAKDQ